MKDCFNCKDDCKKCTKVKPSFGKNKTKKSGGKRPDYPDFKKEWRFF